jgi:hypothetical protein
MYLHLFWLIKDKIAKTLGIPCCKLKDTCGMFLVLRQPVISFQILSPYIEMLP